MRYKTAASLARGWQHIIGPAIAVNIMLFGYVMFEPLLVAQFYFFRREEIALARVAYDLYDTDRLLFLIVFIFGIVTPIAKMLASACAWYVLDVRFARRHQSWIAILGKLSMLDIMLIAILIVAIRGIGIGTVNILPGFYFYVFLVLNSLFVSLLMEHLLDRFGTAPRPARSRDPVGITTDRQPFTVLSGTPGEARADRRGEPGRVTGRDRARVVVNGPRHLP